MEDEVILVGVLGAGETDPEVYRSAQELGALIAGRGWWMVCGGLGGVMEAASRGARETGGTVLGILPGTDRSEANRWVSAAVVTGMSEARNVIIARTSHACIALPGSFGTQSEIAFCRKFGTPVAALLPTPGHPAPAAEIPVLRSSVEACDWLAEVLSSADGS